MRAFILIALREWVLCEESESNVLCSTSALKQRQRAAVVAIVLCSICSQTFIASQLVTKKPPTYEVHCVCVSRRCQIKGGQYGGGGGGSGTSAGGGPGGSGAVRIIWGKGRQYPQGGHDL